MSTFIGLHTSLSGIRAGQRGLDTASHNVSNANTPGYTRQRVNLASRIPWQSEVGPIGTGVDVTGVERMRDAFLDTRVRTVGESFVSTDTRAALLQRAEDVLGEPEDGVTGPLGAVFDSFDDLAISPSDPAARAQVIATVDALTNRFHAVATGWNQLSADTEKRLELAVEDVNAQLHRLTELNKTVAGFGDNQAPNDLFDERDLILDKLATSVGATSSLTIDGMVEVSIGGQAAVSAGPPPSNQQVHYDATAQEFQLNGVNIEVGGEIGAIQHFVTTELPTQIKRFDELASAIQTVINGQHALGFDATGAAGGPLIAGTSAATLDVAITDPDRIAAAAVSGAPHDGRIAQAIADLREGPLEEQARDFAVSLGQQVASVTDAADAQESLYVGATISRQSAHSVSLDEEMVSLVQFQRGLEASARVMTAVDQALDTLVNRTGVVGR